MRLTVSCPVKEIYGEDSEEVEILRYFRDNVLSRTPEAKKLISSYYEWSPMTIRAMEENDTFKEDVKEMLDGILPLIRTAE